MNRESIAFETIPAFSTPIVLVDVPDAEAMNADLADALLARGKEKAGAPHGALGGWQSTWDIDSWAGTGTSRLLTIGTTIASRATVNRDGRPVSISWRWKMWANINRRGYGNELRSHPGSFWSGVYCVDDGGAFGDPSLGGELQFLDPRSPGGRDVCPPTRLCTTGRLVGWHEGDGAPQGVPAGHVPCLAVASSAPLSWQHPAHLHCLQSQPVNAMQAQPACPAGRLDAVGGGSGHRSRWPKVYSPTSREAPCDTQRADGRQPCARRSGCRWQ